MIDKIRDSLTYMPVGAFYETGIDLDMFVDIVRNGEICEPVKGASLIGTGTQILKDIDMVGQNLDRGQGVCGSVSGSVPTDVGQPLIRVSNITVGGR